MSQYYETIHRTFSVDGAYPRGTRVKLSATANTVTAAGPADIAIGVLTAASFGAGTPVDVLLKAFGTRPAVASGPIAWGARVYPDANGQVTATPNGVPVGINLWSASAQGDFIELLESSEVANGGKIYTAVGTTDTVTNLTAETAFVQQVDLPANLLQVGDRLKIKAALTVTGHNSTNTLNVKLYVGGNAIAATGAVNNAANDIVYFDAEVVVRTITAAGTIVATGVLGDGTPGTATALPFLFESAALDSTIAETIKLTATWSVASAANIVRLDVLNVDRIAA
jgi:hypothetical protein